jgi:hypothetical protein
VAVGARDVVSAGRRLFVLDPVGQNGLDQAALADAVLSDEFLARLLSQPYGLPEVILDDSFLSR